MGGAVWCHVMSLVLPQIPSTGVVHWHRCSPWRRSTGIHNNFALKIIIVSLINHRKHFTWQTEWWQYHFTNMATTSSQELVRVVYRRCLFIHHNHIDTTILCLSTWLTLTAIPPLFKVIYMSLSTLLKNFLQWDIIIDDSRCMGR